MTLDDLIRRLEAATGPDRNIDADIVMTVVYPATRDMPRSEYGGWVHPTLGLIAPASEYTGSIDAALTLVQDHYRWLLDKRPYGHRRSDGFRAQVYPQGSPDKPVEHWGPTPALALCIASLRARAATERTEE